MSGPKISFYQLDQWGRNIVRGQIRYEQQALAYCEQTKFLLADCSDISNKLNGSLDILELLQKKCGGQEKIIQSVKVIKDTVKQEMEKIKDELISKTPIITSKYTISDEALESKRNSMEKVKSVYNKALELKNKIDKAANAGKEAGRREQRKVQDNIVEYLSADNENLVDEISVGDLSQLEENISEIIGGVVSFDMLDETAYNDLVAQKEIIQNRVKGLLRAELPNDISKQINNALKKLEMITDMQELKNFNGITIKNLFIKLKEYEIARENECKQLAELMLIYKSLCDMAECGEEKNRSFDNLNDIKEAMSNMEKVIYEQREQNYVADSVDEVMKEMGYDLIGEREVRKKSGKHFKNELYQFREGTAVNITYSDDGRIAMELGGLAREDRIPTNEETSILTHEMETFCSEFAEFEKRMKARGIVVGNRIKLLPPSGEYAAIINVNDYNLKDNMTVSEMNVSRKSNRVVTVKKAIGKDD